MKITLTGSLGHIGRPLTETLTRQGHTVTVISSNPERRGEIEALGATAAIGQLTDVEFLTTAFTAADLAYVMAPPANYFDHGLNLLEYFRELGRSFAVAVRASGVKRVVNLSSIGAHMPEGNGILKGTYHVEQALEALPADVAVTHIRPTSIYYNLLGFTEQIRYQGAISSNMGPDTVNVHVATKDIAEHVADEINHPGSARGVRYVASEELKNREVAATLGVAIGRPNLEWKQVSDEDYAQGLIAVGMNPAIARGLAEMYAAIGSGALYEHYRKHEPARMGNVKLKDFANTFAAVYDQPK